MITLRTFLETWKQYGSMVENTSTQIGEAGQELMSVSVIYEFCEPSFLNSKIDIPPR